LTTRRLASELDRLSELLSQQDVELAILISGRLRARLRAGGLRDLLDKLLRESEGAGNLLRVKVRGPGGDYRIYAFRGMIVGVVGETPSGVLIGSKALEVLEDMEEAGLVDIWEVDVSALPQPVAEALGAAKPRATRPPPPEGWVGLELAGFRVAGIHSSRGSFSYVLRARAPWGEDVALKVAKIRVGSDASLQVFRLVSEAQALARIASADRRVVELHLDIMGYPRDVAGQITDGRMNVVRVYAVYTPRESYESVEEYLYTPPFTAMELAEGDLDRLESEYPREELAEAVAGQVGRALAVAHSLGIGHFDLKPANVLYKRGPRGSLLLKLSDFAGYNRVNGRFIVNLFTPEYSDPLLIAARGRGVRLDSDVFNFATLLYRALVGRPLHCVWVLNLNLLSLITNTPPPAEAERLMAAQGEVGDYARAVHGAVTLARKERLGASSVLERLRSRYEECVSAATSRFREPLRSALRRALTLNQRARPRDAVDFYVRSLSGF
jgi:serine/threonine protein kinase